MAIGNLSGFIKRAQENGDHELAKQLRRLESFDKKRRAVELIKYYLEKSIDYEIGALGGDHEYVLNGYSFEEDLCLEDIHKAFAHLKKIDFFEV